MGVRAWLLLAPARIVCRDNGSGALAWAVWSAGVVLRFVVANPLLEGVTGEAGNRVVEAGILGWNVVATARLASPVAAAV